MTQFTLSPDEISRLKTAHRGAKKKRDADRIKAIILLGTGWSTREVSEALLLDDETLRNYSKQYLKEGLQQLLTDKYRGYSGKLSDAEIARLDEHLNENIYLRVEDIVAYVSRQFRVEYSISGMTELLHRMGYVYKKPKLVPGKPDKNGQEEFIADYHKLKENKGENDPVYFMDGTHPQHNCVAGYGWIKKGKDKELSSNTGRQRLNINGTINIENLSTVVHFADSINAQSTITLLKKIEPKHPQARVIYVYCDNAKYYKSRLVKEYLATSKIKIIFLPPYSPNLNLIERLWKYFKKIVVYNTYYETFTEFKNACHTFFRCIKSHRKNLSSLLTENFQIIGTKT